MRILKIAGGILAGLILAFLVVGLFLPEALSISRSTTIDAPRPVVFAQVNDFDNWEHWSPWADQEYITNVEVGDPSAGEGATQSWTSDGQGDGSQTITKSVPNERVESHLDFGEMGEADAVFTFAEAGDGTEVTWAFRQEAGGLADRYIFLMIKSMLVDDYDRGLAQLKAHSESLPTPAPATAPAAATAPGEGTMAAAGTAATAPAPAPMPE